MDEQFLKRQNMLSIRNILLMVVALLCAMGSLQTVTAGGGHESGIEPEPARPARQVNKNRPPESPAAQ
ncbi:unnamed protein product [Allacma fusca]|uniref:Uncharacterized protein n=1 Tax=Allacma fusca TaxID=39272 RepID=A0A8J2L3F8_9HEXA|nr:unnamed protein product [Allacma fusca]